MIENLPSLRAAGVVSNLGDPLRFTGVEKLAGIVAEAARDGEHVKIWPRLSLSSDDDLFHQVIGSLEGSIRHMAEKAGVSAELRHARTALLVIHPDDSAELWLDTAAISLSCIPKRALDAGTVVFESDIADIVAMGFPCVEIGVRDKVLCVFREGWSFGLSFDFNPEGALDLKAFSASLGTLVRTLRYRHIYSSMATPAILDPLLNAGWFPFAEIVTTEFRELAEYARVGWDLANIEAKLVAAFTPQRLEHMLGRWNSKSHFSARSQMLKEAVDSFLSLRPTSAIKILLTEIEGLLCDAYRSTHGGQGAKLRDLLTFAVESAENRIGRGDTLLFPIVFGQYLRQHTFANFDPVAQTGTAGSRHAVGHGAATQDSYTMSRALQAILTVDQLAFYT